MSPQGFDFVPVLVKLVISAREFDGCGLSHLIMDAERGSDTH